MTQNDFELFGKILAVLSAVFPADPITPQRMEIYFDSLKEYDINDIGRAAANLRRTWNSSWFPPIAEFIEAIAGTVDEMAAAAWYRYLEALKHPGPYRSLNMDDPFAHAVLVELKLWGKDIDELGYPDARVTGKEVPESQPDGIYYVPERSNQTPFLKAEFCKRYTYHMRHSDVRSLPAYVAGINAVENKKALASGEARNWTPKMRELVARPTKALPVGWKPEPMDSSAINPKADQRAALPAPTFEEMPESIKALVRGRAVSEIRKPHERLTEQEVIERKQKILADAGIKQGKPEETK